MALRWGILGLGRAGRARARAILADSRSELVCAHRGSPGDLPVQMVPSVDDLLEVVDAVAVCSPDPTHPRLVRRALEAGKHVVCEFPLAGSARAARELYGLADSTQRVLHVEHIELLTPVARWMRAHVRPRDIGGGAVRFRTGLRPEVFSVAHANVARLHRIVDIAGVPRRNRLQHATLTELAGVLEFRGGAHLEIDFAMAPETPRKLELMLELGMRGRVLLMGRTLLFKSAPVELPSGRPLFEQDHNAAVDAIVDGACPYVDRGRVLAVLELADRLDAAARDLGAYDEVVSGLGGPTPA